MKTVTQFTTNAARIIKCVTRSLPVPLSLFLASNCKMWLPERTRETPPGRVSGGGGRMATRGNGLICLNFREEGLHVSRVMCYLLHGKLALSAEDTESPV